MSTWWIVAALFAVLKVEIESRLIGHYLSAMEPSGELRKKDMSDESAKTKQTSAHQRRRCRSKELLGKRSAVGSAHENALLYRLLSRNIRGRTAERVRFFEEDLYAYLYRANRQSYTLTTNTVEALMHL